MKSTGFGLCFPPCGAVRLQSISLLRSLLLLALGYGLFLGSGCASSGRKAGPSFRSNLIVKAYGDPGANFSVVCNFAGSASSVSTTATLEPSTVIQVPTGPDGRVELKKRNAGSEISLDVYDGGKLAIHGTCPSGSKGLRLLKKANKWRAEPF